MPDFQVHNSFDWFKDTIFFRLDKEREDKACDAMEKTEEGAALDLNRQDAGVIQPQDYAGLIRYIHIYVSIWLGEKRR